MSNSSSFANLVRQRRKALDLTQADLARAASCAVVTIKRIEQGTLRPSRLLAERLATALAVSPAERASFVRRARSRLHPVVPPANPYKGLHAFQETDAADFFGRAALVERLGERLAAGRLLAVVGPSGSGKSSVVRAGLIPALRRAAASQQQRLIVVEMLPGAHPFDALRAALLDVLPRPARQRLTGMAHDARFVSRALRRALPADDQTEALLFIDQFEELFTLCTDDGERAAFLDGIAHTIATTQQPIRMVITLRADFFDRPLHYRAFGELLRSSVEFVLPLSDDEARLAVVEPAARAGVTVEPALTTALIRDVRNRIGALPLLQYTLTELFERRTGACMTLAAYKALGGIAGALANRADAIYQTLAPPAQDAVRQVFLHLVHPGEAMDDTRQRVRIARFAGDEVSQALAQYGAARLLTFDHDPTSAEPTVEIAHEALFSAWGRLRNWIEMRRDDLRVHRWLALAADEWDRQGRTVDYLAVGARLAHFEALAGGDLLLTAVERAFVAASVARREELAQEEAARQAALRESLAHSEAQRLAAEANRLIQQGASAELAALLALESLDIHYTPQGDEALCGALRADLPVRRLAGHARTICTLAFSADGRFLLSGGRDGAVLLWSLQNGALVRRLGDGGSDIICLAVDPHGAFVCCGGGDTPIRRYDLHTGEPAGWQIEPDGAQRNFDLSADGRTLFVVAGDGAIAAYDTATGALVRRLATATGAVRRLACADRAPMMIAGYDDGNVRIWNSATGVVERTLRGRHAPIIDVSITSDARYAITAGQDEAAIVWDLATGAPLRTFEGMSAPPGWARIAPDGKTAALGFGDGTITVCETQSGRILKCLSGQGGTVFNIAYSPDGTMIAAGGTERAVLVWDLRPEATPDVFAGHRAMVQSLALSPDGTLLISGSQDRTARVWDVTRRSVLHVLRPGGEVISASFAPDGRSAFTGDSNGVVVVWDLASGAALRSIVTGHSSVNAVACSPDGRLLLTCGGDTGHHDAAATLFDLATGALVRQFTGHQKTVGCVAYARDGRRILTGSDDWTARVWDVTAGATVVEYRGHTGAIWGVALSPDGRTAATASMDRTVHLWDAASGAPIRVLGGHTAAVQNIAFSPDGQLLLSGGADGTARLWNSADGREVRRFVGHQGPLGAFGSVIFLPDSARVATAGADGAIRCWHIDHRAAMDALRRRLLRELTLSEREQYGLECHTESARLR